MHPGKNKWPWLGLPEARPRDSPTTFQHPYMLLCLAPQLEGHARTFPMWICPQHLNRSGP